ncbi:hypothetical protein EN929_29280, partial [Mesorhizobium sp. M7A.F.Ca.CA.004.11.1.1]
MVRETPSRRASSAVEARAFSRSRESRACSASLSISTILPGRLSNQRFRFEPNHASIRRASCESGLTISEGSAMKKIVVVGAGKIGSTIAEMLAAKGDYQV